MNNNAIVKKMNAYLYEATKELASWLNEMLPKSGEEWWNECVISNLSFHQQEMVQQKGISKLDEFDLAALLRIADKSWYTMRSYAYLPTSEHEVIRDMLPF